jgi:beta-fructofuranosidase
MTLTLEDKWVWDLWLSPEKVEGTWHIFFLQAPRSLINPDLRHASATVGHAISTDLIDWQYLGTALEPSQLGAWDDRAIWTGSIIKSDTGLWHMFYTGTNKSKENGFVQRIGVATSTDLVKWEKKEGFVTEADARWYERAAQVMEEKQEGQPSWYEIQIGFNCIFHFSRFGCVGGFLSCLGGNTQGIQFQHNHDAFGVEHLAKVLCTGFAGGALLCIPC